MTCQEVERMVTPFINDQLTGDETEMFLNHLEECRGCQEELEIYFMVDVGIRQLEDGSGTFDIAGDLRRKVEDSYGQISFMWGLRTVKYAVNTLAGMALLVTVLLQFRLWLI